MGVRLTGSICLALACSVVSLVPPPSLAATFVILGFAGGALQSATDAGAPADAAARLAKETRFAAQPAKGPGGSLFGRGWRGEWAIPFSALGLTPSPDMKVAFNMGAYYSEFGEWHCWEGTLLLKDAA